MSRSLGLTVALSSLILSLAPTPARAQAELFSNGAIAVYDAHDLVNEPDGKTFTLGEDLRLTLKHDLPTAGIEARIYALGGDARTPFRWAGFGPCDVFLSLLIPQVLADRRIIDLGRMQGLGYLTAEHGQISSGRFLIIFESRSDLHDLVRLNRKARQDQAAYFARALYIEVRPDRTYSATEARAREAELERLVPNVRNHAELNAPSATCYAYRLAAHPGSHTTQLAMLRACEAPSDDASPAG